MRPRIVIEAVTQRTTLVLLVVLEVGLLTRRSRSVRSNTAAALDTSHPATSRHTQGKVDVDHLDRG